VGDRAPPGGAGDRRGDPAAAAAGRGIRDRLQRDAWGHGYAAETGLALAQWAFGQGIEQVIALVRPANARAAAMVRRIGMEWVGETEKYHRLRLQEFRLRPGDLT
jgi:ribosomal-protein-alanine N-acetyltransferase